MSIKIIIKIFLVFLTLCLAISQAHAHQESNSEDTPYRVPKPGEETILHKSAERAEKACGGYARAGYIRTDTGNSPSERAVALGGEYGCEINLTDNINIHLGLSTSIDPGLNSDNDARVHGDFFDADKDSYAMPGTALLIASLGKLEAHLGRQIFDPPHMDSDDLRMIPNRFEV